MRSLVLGSSRASMAYALLPSLLSLALVACSALQAAALEPTILGEVTDAARGRHLLADSCASQGLDGTCSGKCCCCYAGGAGIVTYRPTDTCTCERVLNTGQIWATVVLSIILVLGGLLLQLYFGSSLPVSPYPGARERRAAARQRAAQRGSRVTPDQPMPPPPPPAVLATR
ncbi:hypothetical protein ABPG77_006002 [Micractinium sp. CCAP 211/92]